MTPKKGYNDKKFKANYDGIDWSSIRKNKQGFMGSKTRVHPDSRAKLRAKIDKQEINDSI